MPTVIRQAPAKINLCLRLLGRRPDGYRELRTILQTISLADRLEIACEPAAETRVELRCNRPELENDGNLAARAAMALLQRLGLTARVRIRLRKNIPCGAGLGGGSSDAAAVLTALGGLLPSAPDEAALYDVAAGLGSDVPFFLVGGAALGIGRGEEVYPLADRPAAPVVVAAVPGAAVSTAWAYRAFARRTDEKLTPAAQRRIMNSFRSTVRAYDAGGAANLAGTAVNDFEPIVFRQFPQLENIKQRLLAAGARLALMSGSGSALFAIFESGKQADDAARSCAAEGLDAAACRFLPRAEYPGAPAPIA